LGIHRTNHRICRNQEFIAYLAINQRFMKQTIATLLLITTAIAGFSQKKISVTEEQNTLSVGSVNTLTVTVYGMSYDDAEKAWKKQLKDINGDVKVKKEVFADDCLIKDMSENTFDVYAMLKEVDNGVKVIAAYDLGGAYLSAASHKEYFAKISKMMYDFGVEQTKEAIGSDIKVAEDDLKESEKAKEDLEKDIKKLEKDIEDYKQKIEDSKKAIEDNKSGIETKKTEIESKKEVIKALENKRDAVN
jgi:hypothetical protein